MQGALQVIAVGSDEIDWSFTEDYPTIVTGSGRYPRRSRVDPFPAYAHDATLTERVLHQVADQFPVGCPVTVRLLPYEELSRTNGHTAVDEDYDAEKDANGQRPINASITLSGKRIPPHPAMTRYLVAHEYGHVVERWLAFRRGEGTGSDAVERDYAAMRCLDLNPPRYGGRTWHLSNGEIFANDFRLLIAGIEPEFWPHPVTRPDALPENGVVRLWWAQQQREALEAAAA